MQLAKIEILEHSYQRPRQVSSVPPDAVSTQAMDRRYSAPPISSVEHVKTTIANIDDAAPPDWKAMANQRHWMDALSATVGITLPDGVAPDEVWVHIDTENDNLSLMQGDTPIKEIDRIAIGTQGGNALRVQGSSETPLGEFRIDHINEQSQYQRFFRIDYPTPEVADNAYDAGLIDRKTANYIRRYHAQHGRAPMGTPLGGQLGIHGLGRKDPFLHQRVDWTEGCVAVNNEEIMALASWLKVGTRVVIQ
jgi:hypothetical protein